jgi:hypothetical protein
MVRDGSSHHRRDSRGHGDNSQARYSRLAKQRLQEC